MSSTRIVSVFGATGLQGAAVARALLKDGTFSPRAITRNPNSEAALKLKAEGIEVVKGDPLGRASLTDALRGSEAVFAADGPNELVQGINMVDAAKEAGVKFFIFTSLPSLANASGGKCKNALHYEQKAEVEEYLRGSGLPHACLHLGSFLENYWASTRRPAKDTHRLHDRGPILQALDHDELHVGRARPACCYARVTEELHRRVKGDSGKVYTVLTERVAYETLAEMTGKVLGAEVCFTTAPPTGLLPLDEMFQSHAELNIYEGTDIPNPERLQRA
ncbi:hypothetical protein DFH06DRAFT_1324776 [Mycena polygramma]|nr:hypothetical protein DFH06DRAFT_1324776 [Mycena polygramma]